MSTQTTNGERNRPIIEDDKASFREPYVEAIGLTDGAQRSRGVPVSPRVPWREGGIWHVGSSTGSSPRSTKPTLGHRERDEHSEEFRDSTIGTASWQHRNSGGRVSLSDSDSESMAAGEPEGYQNVNRPRPSFETGLEYWYFGPNGVNDVGGLMGLELDLDLMNGLQSRRGLRSSYSEAELHTTECYVCFEVCPIRRRLCCDFPACDDCLRSYLVVQVSRANVNVECINSNCNSDMNHSEILARLPVEQVTKFYTFLIDASKDPTVKTCPRCSYALKVDKRLFKKRKVMKNGLSVTCRRCRLDWCFTCHAPWHTDRTCKEYSKGELLLKDWAKEFHFGQVNAQQCPNCKIFIQRSLGCDHMICFQCSTSFCYKCGENYRSCKFLGNHFSRMSTFGCRYNLYPNSPHKRRLVRGAVLGGKILGGIALSGFVVAAGACLLGVGVVALPVWGGYKLHKRRKLRRRLRTSRLFELEKPAYIYTSGTRINTEFPFLPSPGMDSPDFVVDDSSDEMRDHSLQDFPRPESQCVEVIIHHHSTSSSIDQEEAGAAAGGMQEAVIDSPVIPSDNVEEVVVNEDGSTTLVTSVLAIKPSQATQKVSAGNNSDVSDEEDDSDVLSDIRIRVRHLTPEKEKNFICGEETEKQSKMPLGQLDDFHDAEKKLQEKKDKPSTENEDSAAENSDKKCQEKELSCPKTAFPKEEEKLEKETTNGCFGNIFSKKITVIQIAGRRNTDSQTEPQKPNIRSKSATWEKIKHHEKSSNHKPKLSMDIRDLSHFKEKLSSAQPTESCVKGGSYEKGLLLHDCVVLAPPGDFTSSHMTEGDDSCSVSSQSSAADDDDDNDDSDLKTEERPEEEEDADKKGEESCRCLSSKESFRESNLSCKCDVVTYL